MELHGEEESLQETLSKSGFRTLQAVCNTCKLHISGKKAELVERLVHFFMAQQ